MSIRLVLLQIWPLVQKAPNMTHSTALSSSVEAAEDAADAAGNQHRRQSQHQLLTHIKRDSMYLARHRLCFYLLPAARLP
jgi:hypothetical protein